MPFSAPSALRPLAAALLCTITAAAHAGDVGAFDTAWGNGSGRQILNFDLGGSHPTKNRDVAVDSVIKPDGTMFVAGTVTDTDGRARFGVGKLLPNGTYAASFKTDAKDGRATSIRNNLVATSIALSPNGLLVYVAGYSIGKAADNDFVVCQFSATSGANHVFASLGGDNTCVDVAFPGGTMDRAADIVVQPDGRILLAGITGGADLSNSWAAFVRLMPDGSRDTSFGRMENANLVTVRSPPVYSLHKINAVTVLSDGTIVAAGETMQTDEEDWNALMVTLKSDGTNAKEYDYDGESSGIRNTFIQDITSFHEPGAAKASVVVSGKSEWSTGRYRGYLAKLFIDGSKDLGNFGMSGQVVLPPQERDTEFRDIAQQQNGNLLVLGADTTVAGDATLFVRRFTRTGAVDASFGTSVAQTGIDFQSLGGNDLPAGISVRGDSAVYVGGHARQNDADVDFYAAKLELEGLFSDGFED